MTYIDYMNQFWRVASSRLMPASEVALYAFLVNECNAHYWKMPVSCSTLHICESLRMSKQTLMTARKHLAEQGLICFSNGKSRFLPSEYSLLELTVNLTHDFTLNNKDKDKNQFNFQSSKSHHDSTSIKNRRRSVEIHATSAEDYETSF